MAFASTYCCIHVCLKNFNLQLLLWVFLGLICLVGAIEQVHLPKSRDMIKTMKTQQGDIFDCVDIYKQPAFSNPLLKDHKLQMRPTSSPKEALISDEDFPKMAIQNVALEGEGCPEGTIPVHRLLVNTSQPYIGLEGETSSNSSESNYDIKRMWAVTKTYDGVWYGGGGAINVYALPTVERSQSSGSYMGINNQKYGAGILTGWAVWPALFGDSDSRFFVAYIANQKVCYNLQCSGFVQVNKDVHLGAAIRPLSTYRGKQFEMRLYMFKDMATGDWWVSYLTPSNHIGYWPKSLFTSFDDGTRLQFGGVASCRDDEVCPPVGNGHFPDDYPFSCFVRNAQYINNYGRKAFQLLQREQVYTHSTSPKCYNVGEYLDSYSGFFFGGPGC